MSIRNIRPGDAVGVPASVAGGLATVEHVGIVSDRKDGFGRPYVINASKRTGRVLEESWHDFSQGLAVRRLDLEPQRPRRHVLRDARGRIGQEWRLFSSNCEHFVRECMGYVRRSPQLRTWAAGALLIAVVGVGLAAVAGSGTRRRRIA